MTAKKRKSAAQPVQDQEKIEFASLIVKIYSRHGAFVYQTKVRETYAKALRVLDQHNIKQGGSN